MTIEGYEVLEIMPDFASAPKITASRAMSISESKSPRLAQFNGKHAIHGFAHRFVLQSRAEIDALADFFTARAGRWQSFFIPSWHAELNPVAGILNGGTTLSITPIGYAAKFIDATNLRRLGNFIFLLRTDGVMHITRVSSATVATPEVLTLATAVPSAFPLGSFFVGFMYLVRSVNDRLDLDFNGASYATTRLQMVETVDVIETGAAESNPKSLLEQGAWKDHDGEQFKDNDGVSWNF